MDDKKKLRLASAVLDIIEGLTDNKAGPEYKHVGHLNKNWGINGFRVCEPGHPVFDKGDRYVMHMETLPIRIDKQDVIRCLEIEFYKKDIQQAIDFFPRND